jgi:hypothetical protein
MPYALVLAALIAVPAAPDSLPPWVARDTAARTVMLTLEASRAPGDSSASIAATRAGAITIIVPLSWTVKWRWQNNDQTAAHSLVVMPEREKVPLEGGSPAFPDALTRAVKDGLPAGAVDRATFLADQAGWYWMLCGVPGHAADGEWIGLRVDPRASDVGIRRQRDGGR